MLSGPKKWGTPQLITTLLMKRRVPPLRNKVPRNQNGSKPALFECVKVFRS